MTDEQFIKFLSAERVYKERVKKANAEKNDAYDWFVNFFGSSANVETYLAEKKRRGVKP